MKKKLLYISLVISILLAFPAFQQPPIETQLPFLKIAIDFTFYSALVTFFITAVLLVPNKEFQPLISLIAFPFVGLAFFGLIGAITLPIFFKDFYYKDKVTYMHSETNEQIILQTRDDDDLGGRRYIRTENIIGDRIRLFNIENSLNLRKGKWYVLKADTSRDSVVIQ